jgi:hypothetical protein
MAGEPVVIMIDNAHLINATVLEQIRRRYFRSRANHGLAGNEPGYLP